MSPTSTLDIKPFSSLRSSLPNQIPKGIADALLDDSSTPDSPRPEKSVVLFGSLLRIQIPPLPTSIHCSVDSPQTPVEFGIKNRNSQLGHSQSPAGRKPLFEPVGSPRVFTGFLSKTEMEMSEDYTCVISHGPVPRTTHIFDNCIVESCCGAVGISTTRNRNRFLSEKTKTGSYPSQHFLSFCQSCKKNLDQGQDIYMYRGEKAFCSGECRDQVILLEEGFGKPKPKDRREHFL